MNLADQVERLTRMPQTIEISSAVGTTWNTTDDSRNEIPLARARKSSVSHATHHTRSRQLVPVTHLVPRSIALVKPPVWRVRWKPMSRLSKCVNTFRATRRIACCATDANTALRSSEKAAAPTRASPSAV